MTSIPRSLPSLVTLKFSLVVLGKRLLFLGLDLAQDLGIMKHASRFPMPHSFATKLCTQLDDIHPKAPTKFGDPTTSLVVIGHHFQKLGLVSYIYIYVYCKVSFGPNPKC